MGNDALPVTVEPRSCHSLLGDEDLETTQQEGRIPSPRPQDLHGKLNKTPGEKQTCFPDALLYYIRVLRLHQPGTRLKGFKASVLLLRLFINVTEPEPRNRSLRGVTFNRVVRALGHLE